MRLTESGLELAAGAVLMVGLLSAGGCASITAMQTAKPLAEGEGQRTIGLSASSLKREKSDSFTTTIPGVDLMMRGAASKRDEIGVRIANFASFFVADYKHNFVARKYFYLSAGLGVGGMALKDSTGANYFFDVYLPLYVDFNLSKSFALVASPKYIFRLEGARSRQAAMSGGVKIGEKKGVLLEVAYAKEQNATRNRYWQVMAGIFKNSPPSLAKPDK